MLYAKLAGAKLYPSVDLLARGGGGLSGDNSGLEGAVMTLSWELDLWGRIRYGRAAARADFAAAAADFEYARQSMAALVAKSWFLATEAELQAEVARANIRDGDELVRLAEARSRIGVGNDEEVFVARASIGVSRDALRGIELAREQAIRALELLIGRYPGAALAVAPQLPAQPNAVPSGLPSELLERRPDVVAAERRVAAAFNRIGEAKAARLPAISLTTGVSSITSELFVLKSRENPMWNLGASLLAPLYQGGALRTQVEIRTAQQKQAVAAYASIGLRAFSEVENALSAEIRRQRSRADPAHRRWRTTGAPSRSCRPSSRSAAPTCASSRSASSRSTRRASALVRVPGRTARPTRQSASRARRQLRAAVRRHSSRGAEERRHRRATSRPMARESPGIAGAS